MNLDLYVALSVLRGCTIFSKIIIPQLSSRLCLYSVTIQELQICESCCRSISQSSGAGRISVPNDQMFRRQNSHESSIALCVLALFAPTSFFMLLVESLSTKRAKLNWMRNAVPPRRFIVSYHYKTPQSADLLGIFSHFFNSFSVLFRVRPCQVISLQHGGTQAADGTWQSAVGPGLDH